MLSTCIILTTKDRAHTAERAIEPLLNSQNYFFWLIDGSTTDIGLALVAKYENVVDRVIKNVRGGSGPAIVFALSEAIKADYDYIGLVEQDVLLPADWFDKTMALFEQGKQDGLEVGAVSARCYEDRVLIQRPGYAVCHNLGAGFIIMTREAAELVLQHYRTQWTTENRHTFAMLTRTDIGKYWAFRGQEHFLVADWRWDALLASKGLASLALTPSPVTMIGQVPPLDQQGLTIATGSVAERIDDKLFYDYSFRLRKIREGILKLPDTLFHRDQQGYTIFAHQIGAIDGYYQGKWKLKDAPGFGPFGWIADSHQEDWDPRIHIPIAGPCEILVSGGKEGGQVEIIDEQTGFNARPILPPETQQGTIVSVNLPGNVAYRTIRINMSTPGCVFYGVRTRDEQPRVSNWKFDWNTLPHGRSELA